MVVWVHRVVGEGVVDMNSTTGQAQTGMPKTAHTIQTDRRKKTVITGVADVCSFHETEIVLRLESGHLFLTGQGLHIGKLLPDESRLDVDGQIDSIVYETPRKPAAKLFSWGRNRG